LLTSSRKKSTNRRAVESGRPLYPARLDKLGEVIDRDLRVGQDRADRGGVAGVPVGHHHLNPGPERFATCSQPVGVPILGYRR
jgi:hypothetical protein